jgi:hypothetical protein
LVETASKTARGRQCEVSEILTLKVLPSPWPALFWSIAPSCLQCQADPESSLNRVGAQNISESIVGNIRVHND